jgi:hypothetical protein
MLECDMLILGSPVYTNQVSAQMKAMFDRLFTWCHIYPLLGKYSLSAVTTGNEGHKETSEFIEKMLATYGTRSFGSIMSIGAFTPGFFPWRVKAKQKNQKLARKVARTILSEKKPASRKIQKQIFKVMNNKMNGVHTINCMQHGIPTGQPAPVKLRQKIMSYFFKKLNMSDKEMDKMAGFMTFELGWWRDRHWLGKKSLKAIYETPVPEDFHLKERLMN